MASPDPASSTSTALDEQVARQGALLQDLRSEVQKVLVGQDDLLEGLLVGLLADGHILLEGLPGLAKSLAVESLATAIGGAFRRIQFTPDLLPSDVVGTQVYEPAKGTWSVRKGPVFANLVLADEINRAPAKVQSALLEAMQERQVSLGGETHRLPDPFLVLATQNPLEQEGTYTLPEAQLDRFMLKLVVGYPTPEQEDLIVQRMDARERPRTQQVATPEQLLAARALLDQLHLDPAVRRYAVDLVMATRDPGRVQRADLAPLIRHGGSPRASLALVRAARAHALLMGRTFVLPEDVKALGRAVLRHRVIASFEAEAEDVTSAVIVDQLLDAVPVP